MNHKSKTRSPEITNVETLGFEKKFITCNRKQGMPDVYRATRILLKFTVIRLFSIWLGKACQKVPEGRSNKIFVDRKHGREEAAEKHSGAEAEEVGMRCYFKTFQRL